MERYLIVTMQIDPAHVQDVIDAYTEHGRVAAATEPGLLCFDVHQDQADPTRIILYEAYADDAAHAAHLEGDSHKRARGVVDSLIERGKARRELLGLRPVFTHPGARR
jgi:quinol monooxygenase YgiN